MNKHDILLLCLTLGAITLAGFLSAVLLLRPRRQRRWP